MSVYIALHGTPTLASELSWLELAPCGCAIGVCWADIAGQVLATPEQAWTFFHELDTKAKADEDLRLGYTVRLARRVGAVDLLVRACPHVPQWGLAPDPAGYRWASPSRGRVYAKDRQHLVRGRVITDPDDYGYGRDDEVVSSLCLRQRHRRWFAGAATDLRALARCTLCLRAARTLPREGE